MTEAEAAAGTATDTATDTATATERSVPRSRDETRVWAATALCAVTLVAAAVALTLPLVPGPLTGLIPEWVAVSAAALGLVSAQATVRPWGRTIPRRAVVTGAWSACLALAAVAVGIAFDLVGLLMWVIGLVTDESGPVVLPMDWSGFATRVPSLAAAALLAVVTLSFQRRSRGACGGCGRRGGSAAATSDGVAAAGSDSWARVLRYAAFPAGVLAFGYGALKAQWGLGGTVGLADPDAFGEDVHLWTPGLGDTAALAVVGVVLALALAHPWGRRLPRWIPLTGAVVGCAMLIPVGVIGIYGTIGVLLSAAPSDTGFLAPWVGFAIYPWFLAWGLTLAAAAWSYYHRTRGRCAECAR